MSLIYAKQDGLWIRLPHWTKAADCLFSRKMEWKKESLAVPGDVTGPTLATRKERAPGFFERTVLGMLRRLPHGCLHLDQPDGSRITFGTEKPGVPAAHLRVLDPAFYRKVIFYGEVGFGEAYVDGLWDTDDLTRLIAYLLLNVEHTPDLSGSRVKSWFFSFLGGLNTLRHKLRRNSKENSRANIAEHYDLSNAFYGLWLDPTWTYSSAFFTPSTRTLEEAQAEKYRRLARSVQLRPGMHVLEIGCGWGGFALYAAREHGVRVTGITVSREQYVEARRRVEAAGLADRVDIRFTDYRDIDGSYDAIVSIEMLEAVGHEFLGTFFRRCTRLLSRTGRLGLQVIVNPDSRYKVSRKRADWIKKHIFPGGQLPSVAAMNAALNRAGDLFLQHAESFGLHYARTLRLWRERFDSAVDDVRSLGFDDAFIRKWSYYLSYCEAAFAMRNINVLQLVYARPNNTDLYLPGEETSRDQIPWPPVPES